MQFRKLTQTKTIRNAQKALSVLSLVWLVFILHDINWHNWLAAFRQAGSPLWLLAIAALWLPNWLLEAYKWQLLLRPIRAISLHESLKQVWIGLAWAFFTPARSGEVFSRALQQHQHKKLSAWLALRSSLAQNLVTLLAGLLALLYVLVMQHNTAHNLTTWAISASTFTIVLLVASLLIDKHLGKHRRGISWLYLILLSGLRYAVFATQLCLGFAWLAAPIAPKLFAAIGLYYLISTLLPVLSIFEFGLKAGVAATVFPWFNYPPEIAITVTLGIWLINLVLPVLLGNLFQINTKPS